MCSGLGRGAIDEFYGVITRQPLEGHQRVSIAEHVRTLGDTPVSPMTAVWLALGIMRTGALAGAGHVRPIDPIDNAADQRECDRSAEHQPGQHRARSAGAAAHSAAPWRPAPAANARAPSAASPSTRHPRSNSRAIALS